MDLLNGPLEQVHLSAEMADLARSSFSKVGVQGKFGSRKSKYQNNNRFACIFHSVQGLDFSLFLLIKGIEYKNFRVNSRKIVSVLRKILVNLYYYRNRQVYFGSCYRRFGCETIHPTQKFTSMNLLQMSCVITQAQLFLTSMEAVIGHTLYRDRTLLHCGMKLTLS